MTQVELEYAVMWGGTIISTMFFFACLGMALINKFYQTKYCDSCMKEFNELESRDKS